MDLSILTLDEVDQALQEIENKYSKPLKSKQNECVDDLIRVLSQEFDSLGLPAIDFSQGLNEKLYQVVSVSRMLVQLHRKMVSEMKDVNINCKTKDNISNDLHKKIDDLKLKVAKSEDKNMNLRNRMIKQSKECSENIKKAEALKEELDKTKRYYTCKINDVDRNIKKLVNENQKLKERLGEDIGIHHSKDDVTVRLIKKFRLNEELYKNTIKKLQENNNELLRQVSSLKEECTM